MTEKELLDSLRNDQSSKIRRWISDNKIGDLRAFCLKRGVPQRRFDGSTYFSSNLDEIFRLPGVGKSSIEKITAWVHEGVDLYDKDFLYLESVRLSDKLTKEIGVPFSRVRRVADFVGAENLTELRGWISERQPNALTLLMDTVIGRASDNLGKRSLEKIIAWADGGFDPDLARLERWAERLRSELAELESRIEQYKNRSPAT